MERIYKLIQARCSPVVWPSLRKQELAALNVRALLEKMGGSRTVAGKRDGVKDGWILYKAWCKRNNGTPVRGTNSAGHMCIVGPSGQQ